MQNEYSKGHMMRIMGLDAIVCILGLVLAVTPLIRHNFPADIDTTAHVTVGMLVATLAAFRVLLAYGSIWIDIVLIAFGVLALRMPAIMHMQWNAEYSTLHLVCGGGIVALSVLALILTVPVINKKD